METDREMAISNTTSKDAAQNMTRGVDQAVSGETFGFLLRRHRLAAGLTQEQLADRAELSVRTIRNLERGVTTRPLRHSVQQLAAALGLEAPAAEEFVAVATARSTAGGQRYGGRGAPGAEESGRGWGVPRELPAPVPVFVGRHTKLAALSQVLDIPGGTVTAIGGTAGVGKTALAVHWAHQVADRFPDGQLYVNLRGYDPGQPASPAEALAGFLRALGIPGQGIPPETDQRAARYRSLLAERKMLIVLDNARDEDQVRPLLPASPASLVLVTSRKQLTGLAAADGAQMLSLDILPHGEAAQLLTARIGKDRAAAEPGAVDEIAALCAHLPLALAIAAARAATRPRFPLTQLAAELRGAAGRLDALDAGDPAASVRAVFSWSYQQLGPATARMFRLLGLHPGPDISVPATASLAAVDERRARRLLGELARDFLITEHAPGRYAFHDLLRAYA